MEAVNSQTPFEQPTSSSISPKVRYRWVDVARAFAIIFVYLGHWLSARIAHFSYAFDLSLLFMISGFFAIKQQKLPFHLFLKKKITTILIPYWLWAFISFIIQRFDAETFQLSELSAMLSPGSIQPNYWFFPVLFTISIVFWLSHSLIKNRTICLLISLILYVLWSESGILNQYNVFRYLESLITIDVGSFMTLSGIPTYLFWYELGSFLFDHIVLYVQKREQKPILFHSVGFVAFFLSCMLFLGRIKEFSFLQFVLNSPFLSLTYSTLVAICISIATLYISVFLENSKRLCQIGQQSLVFVGLEYITHGYLPLVILPMINLGIPSLGSSEQLITIVILTIEINRLISNWIVRFFPILNGNRSN